MSKKNENNIKDKETICPLCTSTMAKYKHPVLGEGWRCSTCKKVIKISS